MKTNRRYAFQNFFDTIQSDWRKKEFAKARIGCIAASLPAFWLGTGYGLKTLGSIPLAVIKLPFSLVAITSEKKDFPTCHKIHEEILPGITDVMPAAFKCTVSFFNVFWSPILGMLSPMTLYQWYIKCGLIGSPTEETTIEKPKQHTLEDVAGMESLKEQIQKDIISPLKNPDPYNLYGVSPPDGVLFYGPPGCGKTLIAKAIAGTLGWSFKMINLGEMGSPYVHQTAKNIKDVFKEAEDNAPCILFFDEFDSLGGTRTEGINGFHSARNEEVNQLLQELDTAAERRIFVIAATNFIDRIDPAVKRSKRITHHIEIPLPDLTSRKAQIEFCLNIAHRRSLVEEHLDINRIAQATKDYSSADIIAFVEGMIRSKITRNQTNEQITALLSTDDFVKAAQQQQPKPHEKSTTSSTSNQLLRHLQEPPSRPKHRKKK